MEESEETEESDDSAPHFSQMKHIFKQKLANPQNSEAVLPNDNDDPANEHTKMSKWIKAADRINRMMQGAAGFATKEAQTNNPG